MKKMLAFLIGYGNAKTKTLLAPALKEVSHAV